MNEEFRGGGHGRELGRIRGWDHWDGFGRWERKGRVMGVRKCGKRGKRGKITQQCLKFAIAKWLNDSKNKGENLPRRSEMKVAKKNRGGKN